MVFAPRSRKLVLTAHILFSVGWIGGAGAYLALSIAALLSKDPGKVRAAYLVMDPTAGYALLPMAFGSLMSGLLLALGTSWGLFRHYWVVIKLLLTLVSVLILLGNMRTLHFLAGMAAKPGALDPKGLIEQILHSGGGILVLLVIAMLGMYKPKGMTPYGWRKQQERNP